MTVQMQHPRPRPGVRVKTGNLLGSNFPLLASAPRKINHPSTAALEKPRSPFPIYWRPNLHLKDLANAILDNKITRNSSKTALQEIVKTGKQISQIIQELDLGHVSDESTLSKIIDDIINEETEAVQQAKEKPETINYLVGQVMKKTKGKADPVATLNILKEKLK